MPISFSVFFKTEFGMAKQYSSWNLPRNSCFNPELYLSDLCPPKFISLYTFLGLMQKKLYGSFNPKHYLKESSVFKVYPKKRWKEKKGIDWPVPWG